MSIIIQEEMKFLYYSIVKNKIITLPDTMVEQLECYVVEDPYADLIQTKYPSKSVIDDVMESENQPHLQYMILISLLDYLNYTSSSYHSKYKINSYSSMFGIVNDMSGRYATLQERVDAIVKLYYTEWIKDVCAYEHERKINLGNFALSNTMLELSNNPHGGARQLLKKDEAVNYDSIINADTICHLTTSYADADDSDYKVIPESLTKKYKK